MLEPFQTTVWLWKCFSYLLVVCSWYTICRLSHKLFKSAPQNTSFSTIAFFLFGIQLSQGVVKSELRNLITNFIFICFLISTFFLTSNYIANIKASFLATGSALRIESLEDAMADKNLQIIIAKGTNIENLILNATGSVFREAKQRMIAHPDNFIEYNNIQSGCLDRVRDNNNMACIEIRSLFVQYIADNPGHQLYISKQSVTSGMGYMVVKKGFKYIKIFNEEISTLMETGRYNYNIKVTMSLATAILDS